MSELKFKCETCGQHILVDSREAGRKLTCPSCRTQLTIPNAPAAPPKKPRTKELRAVAVPDVRPSTAGGRAASAPQSMAVAQPAPAAAAKSQTLSESNPDLATERGPTDEAAPKPAQVAVMTAEVKRDIVRAARKLIGDQAHWVAGVAEDGKLTYAAKQTEGRLERVDVDNTEATRYSLLGAVMLELHRHNVTTTATGRTAFLDQDIPAAIRKVVRGEADILEAGKASEPTDQQLMSISHAQCLEVLDRLEGEYAADSGSNADSPALRELRGTSLDELMVRAAKDETISSAELLRAVHRELTDYHRRLSALEKAADTPGAAPSSA